MKAGKILLLLSILLFGAGLEALTRSRLHFDLGPAGCRVLGGRFSGPSYSFDETRDVDTRPEWTLRVDNAFGAVGVSAGDPGHVRVKLRKVVYVPGEEQARQLAQELKLLTKWHGTELRVGTSREHVERGPGRYVGLETHLEISVPADTRVNVYNAHGPVTIDGTAAAEVRSSYDPVVIEHVSGPVVISARHGPVRARFLGSSLAITARHDDVEVQGVDGPLTVDTAHGDVRLKDCGAARLKIRHGSLSAERFSGALDLEGSRLSADIANVRGSVTVNSSGGHVRLRKAAADVVVHNRHGEVAIEDARGSVHVQTSYDDVRLARIEGSINAQVRHGGLRGSDLRAGGHLEATGDDVDLRGFVGALVVEVDGGSVHLEPGTGWSHALRAATTHGSIVLRVPTESPFELDVGVQSGELMLGELQRFELGESVNGRTRGRVGSGGGSVVLDARHGDVTVQTLPGSSSSD